MLGRLRGQDCPELSPYLPLTHSAVSCLYTVTTDTAVYRQALTVSGGKLCTHNHSMKEACFRWVMSTFTLGSLILSKPQPNLNTTVGFDNKMTLQTPPPPPQHRNSISAISQLLLTRFWWNFKGRFLWTFRTDSNCQGDICPCNICPRNICPYQEYLSCYWPDFDETLKVGSCEHLE